MNRYLAILLALLVISVPQFASAGSVNFGAGLDDEAGENAGHAGGSAVDSGNTPLKGKMHWSGTAVTFDWGIIIGGLATLEGTVTRTNDPSLADKRVPCELQRRRWKRHGHGPRHRRQVLRRRPCDDSRLTIG